MLSVVTGVAGFIGSHLAERLIGEGHQVVGIDCFTDYYPRSIKESNLNNLLSLPGFSFIEGNLLDLNLPDLLKGTHFIFHQAAQAGVRSSWGSEFEIYTTLNLVATQRLLEACKKLTIEKFIFASSSSVYGDSEELPLREDSVLRPVSPYGVTKLAGEHLCTSYWKNYNIPTIAFAISPFMVPGKDQIWHFTNLWVHYCRIKISKSMVTDYRQGILPLFLTQ